MYLESYKSSITNLCKQYNVKSLHAFGSVLTDKFNDKSDVDMIVAFNQMPIENYVDNYFDLKFSLQSVLNRSVDLLEEQAIKNPYFLQNISNTKQLIYE